MKLARPGNHEARRTETVVNQTKRLNGSFHHSGTGDKEASGLWKILRSRMSYSWLLSLTFGYFDMSLR